jgi:predicted lipid-binding transport protein (Tim44 family)
LGARRERDDGFRLACAAAALTSVYKTVCSTTGKDHVKHVLLSLALVFSNLAIVAVDAQAQSRLGRGATSGMSRQTPPPKQAQPVPPKQADAAAPATTAGTAATAAAAPKRSWMGPIAGLAAGLGLAALMSHLGLGAEFANILTLMLLGALAFFVGRFLLRRFGTGAANRDTTMQTPQGMRFAGAGGRSDGSSREWRPASFGSGGALHDASAPSSTAAGTPRLPAGFDAAAFERIAKLVFIRMQAANDAGNLDDLRRFSTPEMFATFRLDLQERGPAAQQTDVVQLDAEMLDFAEEAGQQIVSVRFHGLMREQQDAAAAAFDEIWHLVKPVHSGSQWAIAGIAQSA